MWPFSKNKSLSESAVFAGFTDWHSHILPGVDDGVMAMSDSLEILRRYEELGISRVWLTPHVMEDFPNTPGKLQERFEELQDAYKGNIELHLGSENMLDSLFEERLEKNEFQPIGSKGSHLLVETSYVNPPYAMEEMIDRAQRLGYTLILAHPERYRYMEESDYRKWKEMGLLFQSNLISFVGGYGETACRKAEWLLKEGMVDLLGSDIHRLNFFEKGIRQGSKKSTVIEALEVIGKKSRII